jgi:GT2 family glycosyltransferase
LRLSIVIPTFNRSGLLKSLLKSIEALDKLDQLSIEVIVVNDGSKDNTNEMLHLEFSNVHIIHGNGNWWWTKCINEGMNFAFANGANLVLWINDDNELPQNYIIELINAYRSIPEHSILGSASVSIDTPRRIDTAGYSRHNKIFNKLFSYWPIGSEITADFTGILPTISLSGRGTLIPNSVFNQLGLLDEKLIQYGSDDDYIMRAVKKHIPVYISLDAQVLNHSNLTSKERNVTSQSLIDFLHSFLNPYSANSLKKHWRIYTKHCISILAPFYIAYIFSTDLLKFLMRKYVMVNKNQ